MYVTISNEMRRPQSLPATLTSSCPPTVRFKAGAYLYFEGDEVDRLYRIEEGVVRLTRVLEDGRRQVIAFGYPGDFIGFPAQGLHHTDCDVLVDTRLSPIPVKALQDSSVDPALHATLVKAALDEISAMQDHFMMLGRKSANEKVASFLTVLLERFGDADNEPPCVLLPMCRSDIADFLGLTTETVSRCFTALRKAGIISLKGISRVEILNPAALSQRAEGQLN